MERKHILERKCSLTRAWKRTCWYYSVTWRNVSIAELGTETNNTSTISKITLHSQNYKIIFFDKIMLWWNFLLSLFLFQPFTKFLFTCPFFLRSGLRFFLSFFSLFVKHLLSYSHNNTVNITKCGIPTFWHNQSLLITWKLLKTKKLGAMKQNRAWCDHKK